MAEMTEDTHSTLVFHWPYLQAVDLNFARLDGAYLIDAKLKIAALHGAHLNDTFTVQSRQ